MTTVRTDDPDGKRFEIVQEGGRVWPMMSESFDATVLWMDELRMRQGELRRRRQLGTAPRAGEFSSGSVNTVTYPDLDLNGHDRAGGNRDSQETVCFLQPLKGNSVVKKNQLMTCSFSGLVNRRHGTTTMC